MTAQPKKPLSVGAALGDQDLANEQRGLLDLIDKLQFAKLDNVKLPQIVVVGDQSAGKSSVLEAITGTPFPRDAGACTRFATEIRLRRADEERFTIRIIPDVRTRTYAEQERLRQFGATVDESMDFSTLMRLAVDQIAPKNVPGRFATGDILVVEKRGPDMPLLTVVDLPGLVRNPNNDQSADDIKAINDLTDHYMKSSRTIILAVVGGNQDYVQAPVLTKAREFDPTGGRTIGVLTKPDLTESIGLEDKFIALVNNQDRLNHFDLGWYVLLNPGPRESGQEWPSGEERKQAEDEFFSRGKWSTLPPTMCGAAALKQKLSVQLHRHIGKHVGALQKEIQRAHDDCEAELKLLGNGKDTVEEMKQELVDLCSDSKDLVTPAVQGTYTNPPGKSFFPRSVDAEGTPPQNLRARAVDENRRFAQRILTQGQKLHFSSESEPQMTTGKRAGSMTKKDFARTKVEPLLRQNTGTEFPMDHNPRLVYTLFQDYAENWSRLAQEHKNNLGVICNEFLREVIDHVWPRQMRHPLRTEFLDPQMKESMKKAQEQVDLLRTDLHFEIQPYDPEYEDRLRRWRAEASAEGAYTEAEELLEKMLIYYELSAKTFTNNVITQVVERNLLQSLHGVFNCAKINRMDERTVVAIAADNKATREKRMALKAKKVAIEEARDLCAGLTMSKELRIYGRDEPDAVEESSDDDDDSNTARLQSERQTPPTNPFRASGSSTNSPLRSPRQPLREERVRPRPSDVESAPNGDPSTSVFGAAHAATQSTTRTEDPISPPAWDHQSTTDYYTSSTANVPTYSPPPPPRPDKMAQQTTVPSYQSDSAPWSLHQPTQQQQPLYPVQSPANGRVPNGYPQSPVRKPARKSLFGSSA